MRSIARIVMAAVIAVTASGTVMAAGKPLRVYIMAGQSNMQGSAHQSTFKAIGDDPATSSLLSMILDQKGHPVVCDNAWITYVTQQNEHDTVLQGKVKVGYGFDHERIGPEYAFGLFMDKAYDEPVLIIKTAWGGKSLAVDFRPPGAGPYEPSPKEKDQGNAPSKEVVGHYYREMIGHIRASLNSPESIRKIVPGYDPAQGYELAGFVWFQGWNDLCNRYYIGQYTDNMIHFISDVRKEFDRPDLPFIVGILGVYGTNPDSRKFDKTLPVSDFRKAQFAAVEEYDRKVPEPYRGNVKAVDSGPFYELGLSDIYWKQRLTNEWDWRVKQGEMTREEAIKQREKYGFAKGGLTKEEKAIWKRAASNAEYHYLGSGKTFIRLGKAMAEAMLGMEKKPGAVSQVDENVFRDTNSKNTGSEVKAEPVMDMQLNFNTDWRFYLGESSGFYMPGFDDAGWRKLDVPHDWSVEGQFAEANQTGPSGGYLPIGVGCYRKQFVLPEGSKGKRIKIRFDGVYMNSTVYLNGIYLGNRPYGFSTFEYDLTPNLKFDGKTNVIAVKVDNSLIGNCRWYTGSGINRNVHLIITEQQHFKSFATFFRTASIDDGVARLKVDCEVISNNYPESMNVNFQRFPEEWKKITKKARIAALLKDKEGAIFAEAGDSLELGDYSSIKSSFSFEVRNPVLWSDKNPYLYTLELQLWIEGRLVDTERQQVGIRIIEFNKDQGLVVNGAKVILKGVCLHKDAGSFGTAVPKDVWRYRLDKLKVMGCNAIRTHGTVDPVFIDACDEKGFYMMAEAFDEWNKTWHYGRSEDPAGKKPYTYHLFFNQWAETDLKDMVRRDRNHPSVFMYSVGNEVPDQRYPDGPETLKKLIAWAKEEDDTRMVTATCDWSPWANANGFFDAMDIAGYNYPDRYFKEHYREEHARYPNRILLGAENYLTLENWLAVRDNPYVTGLFLWVGIDYLGESLGWPRRGWEWGLIDIAGFEKPLYYYWQAFWSEKPMVHIAVNLKEKDDFEWRAYNVASHWNFKPGDVDTVFVYSNAEKVELYQNGKSLGTKPVNPDTYQAVWLVDYKVGELTAKAFNNKQMVAAHSLKTSGEPKRLAVSQEWKSDGPEGDRLLFLTVEIQDEKGTRCPKAKNEVTVDVAGAGELIGLDSGNQFSHELYKQVKREAHEGRLLLTIRTKGPGSVTVQCHAKDLDSGLLTIQGLIK